MKGNNLIKWEEDFLNDHGSPRYQDPFEKDILTSSAGTLRVYKQQLDLKLSNMDLQLSAYDNARSNNRNKAIIFSVFGLILVISSITFAPRASIKSLWLLFPFSQLGTIDRYDAFTMYLGVFLWIGGVISLGISLWNLFNLFYYFSNGLHTRSGHRAEMEGEMKRLQKYKQLITVRLKEETQND